LSRDKIAKHQAKDPEAFLARLTIVAEGATEVGFLSELLDHALPSWQARGVYITDGGGNDSVLDLLEALAAGGLKFAGFADNEGRAPGRWAALHARLSAMLFRWSDGNLEQSIIPRFPADRIMEFIADSGDERRGMRLRTLAERLKIEDTSLEALTARSRQVFAPEQYGDAHPLVPVIVDAALGRIPEAERDSPDRNRFKGHASVWFKNVEGGRELAEKCRALGVWQDFLKDLIEPFINAVIAAQAAAPPVGEAAAPAA
jgi:putative ATP-dependent endonuclease of the OLD family